MPQTLTDTLIHHEGARGTDKEAEGKVGWDGCVRHRLGEQEGAPSLTENLSLSGWCEEWARSG